MMLETALAERSIVGKESRYLGLVLSFHLEVRLLWLVLRLVFAGVDPDYS